MSQGDGGTNPVLGGMAITHQNLGMSAGRLEEVIPNQDRMVLQLGTALLFSLNPKVGNDEGNNHLLALPRRYLH